MLPKESRGKIPDEKVLKFLRSGVPIPYIRAIGSNIETGEVYGPMCAYTDEIWAWTSALYHYYAIGWVGLPEAFVEHARNADLENNLFLKYQLMAADKKHAIGKLLASKDLETIPLR